jgi:hypothetical protein
MKTTAASSLSSAGESAGNAAHTPSRARRRPAKPTCNLGRGVAMKRRAEGETSRGNLHKGELIPTSSRPDFFGGPLPALTPDDGSTERQVPRRKPPHLRITNSTRKLAVAQARHLRCPPRVAGQFASSFP